MSDFIPFKRVREQAQGEFGPTIQALLEKTLSLRIVSENRAEDVATDIALEFCGEALLIRRGVGTEPEFEDAESISEFRLWATRHPESLHESIREAFGLANPIPKRALNEWLLASDDLSKLQAIGEGNTPVAHSLRKRLLDLFRQEFVENPEMHLGQARALLFLRRNDRLTGELYEACQQVGYWLPPSAGQLSQEFSEGPRVFLGVSKKRWRWRWDKFSSDKRAELKKLLRATPKKVGQYITEQKSRGAPPTARQHVMIALDDFHESTWGHGIEFRRKLPEYKGEIPDRLTVKRAIEDKREARAKQENEGQ